MTLYIGVDIAKDIHYAAMTNQHGEILLESFPFQNSKCGFDLFLDSISSFILDSNDFIIGFESTAHYADNFIHFLESKNLPFKVINPLVTSSLRNANIRNTKTDSIDALLICSALSKEKQKASLHRDETYSEIYSLCCSRRNLIKMRTKAKIQLVSYMDRIFPELAGYFKNNLHINTSYELIKEYPLPQSIKKVRIDVLTKLLTKASHGRYKRDKAVELKKLAEESIGIPSHSFALQAQLAVNQIELYDEQIASIDKELEAFVNDFDTPLKSIRGLGHLEISVFLSVTNNLNNFDSPSKVLAYAGLDPVVRQSGKWRASKSRMSKRGNSLLRYTLIWASYNVCKNNKTFMNYYLKKKSEGKSHYAALGHCAGKLVRVMFKLIKSNESFNLD